MVKRSEYEFSIRNGQGGVIRGWHKLGKKQVERVANGDGKVWIQGRSIGCSGLASWKWEKVGHHYYKNDGHPARGRAHLARGRSYLEKWLTPPWNPRSFHARSPAQTNSSRHHSSSARVVANSDTTIHRHLATSNCARRSPTTSRFATRCRAASGSLFCQPLVYFVDMCSLAVVLLRGASPHPGQR